MAARRIKGAFAGYSAPNDFCCDITLGRGHTSDLQTCCIGSGTRGLFMGWSHIVTESAGTVSVNLLLNRGTRYVDVNNYLPHAGRVDLDIHEDIDRLLIRVPDWAGYHSVRAERRLGDEVAIQTGRDESTWIKQRYLLLRRARRGERITVTFPLSTYRTTETAIGQEFETTWRGEDIIDISPPGTHHPLYSHRRVYYEAPMKEGGYRVQQKN